MKMLGGATLKQGVSEDKPGVSMHQYDFFKGFNQCQERNFKGLVPHFGRYTFAFLHRVT